VEEAVNDERNAQVTAVFAIAIDFPTSSHRCAGTRKSRHTASSHVKLWLFAHRAQWQAVSQYLLPA